MMERPINHQTVPPPSIGVLLVNLGTPDAPTPNAVRRYLREFLSDRRVVEIPPIIWQPILNTFVLATRPRRSAHAYQQIWTSAGSPLAVVTASQAAALQERFGNRAKVDWAMRYGKRSVATQLAELKSAGCDRILIAPLYPQHSGATTASTLDAVGRALATMRWQPAIRSLPPYFDDPLHITALVESTREALSKLDFEPEEIVASFHSMPARTLALGDPYHCQCQKTARLLSEALGRELIVSFQSRLGRAKWLEPATDVTLASIPGKGIKKVAIITPGFAADNLETLEELGIRGRETFLRAGGENFACLPCLNASEPGNAMLEALIRRELAGWL